jgi:hypothetical protein
VSKHGPGPDEYASLGVAAPPREPRTLRERDAQRRAQELADGTAPRERHRRRAVRAGASWRRTRRLVALGVVLVVSAVTLGSALREDNAPALEVATPAPEPASQLVPSPPPRPLKLASRGGVNLYVPIDRSRITAIVYHQVAGSDTLDLTPSGNLLNAGIVDRIERQIIGNSASGPDYFIASGSTASVDVGATAGTQVYAPVNGTIVGITPMILNGARWGDQVSIQPQADPSVVVVVSNIHADPSLRIGIPVTSTQDPTLLGTVADLSKVLKMELARYTADSGNHAHIELRPTPVLAIP